jgi:hypothetical protein
MRRVFEDEIVKLEVANVFRSPGLPSTRREVMLYLNRDLESDAFTGISHWISQNMSLLCKEHVSQPVNAVTSINLNEVEECRNLLDQHYVWFWQDVRTKKPLKKNSQLVNHMIAHYNAKRMGSIFVELARNILKEARLFESEMLENGRFRRSLLTRVRSMIARDPNYESVYSHDMQCVHDTYIHVLNQCLVSASLRNSGEISVSTNPDFRFAGRRVKYQSGVPSSRLGRLTVR